MVFSSIPIPPRGRGSDYEFSSGSFLRRIGLADKIERVGMLSADGIHGQNEGEYQRNAQQCVVKFWVFPVVFNQMLTSIAASKSRGETVFAVK